MLSLTSWKALYADWSEYSSGEYSWEELPAVGVSILTVFHPTERYKTIFSGWDIYVLLREGDVLRAIVWKEDDPEDPYYNMGRERRFYDDGDQAVGIYMTKDAWSYVPQESRKKGVWVDDETAKKMGLL